MLSEKEIFVGDTHFRVHRLKPSASDGGEFGRMELGRARVGVERA